MKRLAWVRDYVIVITCSFLMLLAPAFGFSQRVVVNSSGTLYQLANGSACTSNYQFSYCNPYLQNNFLLSTAIYKDTLIIVSPAGKLFRMKLGDTGGCQEFITFPANGSSPAQINSLVSYKNGMVYAADGLSKKIYKYDPYANILTLLGQLNVTPSGDLIFYQDKLILAAQDGNFYEVNLTNPANSTVYIPGIPGKIFNGLITIPFDCFSNKYFAFERVDNQGITHVYELDMVNRTIVGATCDLPFLVYDGASNTDDGTTLGVSVDSILVNPPCGKNSKGIASIKASSASSGFEYILNNSITNTTGIFTDLTTGTYLLRVKNSRGCIKDTSFTIEYGIHPDWTLEKTRATNCNTADGSIIVHAVSSALPLQFSHNSGPWTSDSIFTGLSGGLQNIKVRDAKGCMVDSNFILGYNTLPSYLNSIETTPSFCTRRNGTIRFVPSAGFSPTNFTTTLNNGPVLQGVQFSNLDAGTYMVHINHFQACSIDTIITVAPDSNLAPIINLQIDQQICVDNNGGVNVALSGNYFPYQTSLDGGIFSANLHYTGLSVGQHNITIQDRDGCLVDTSFAILPYVKESLRATVRVVDPSCTAPYSGQITINIVGNRAPYYFIMRGRTYTITPTVIGLEEGLYTALIYNADNCLIDSVSDISLKMIISPDCETLQVPTGFTPNKDGLNDFFKPLAGGWLDVYRFSIYNRNGELVFYTTDKNKGWDGQYKGVNQPTGVFAWTLQYNTFGNTQIITKKGTLVLIR